MPSPSAPRRLHPVAWWLWALGLAVAASRTTNPVLLLLIVAVAVWTVAERQDPDAGSPLVGFMVLALVGIVLRVVLTGLLGAGISGRVVLFELPRVPLPHWMTGVQLGGPVTAEAVVFALYQGLSLAALLVLVGAANSLASPRRLLRHVPATLYDVGTAVVVALSLAPAMVEDARRVRTGQLLRGRSGRSARDLGRLAMPVLDGGFERSLRLAASMEARGYGRRAPGGGRRLSSVLAVAGLLGVVIGLYGLLDASTPMVLGLPTLAAGLLLALASLTLGSRRDRRTRYRQPRFAAPEWLVVGLGLVPAVVLVVASRAGWDGIDPPVMPLAVPATPVLAALAIAVAALAAVLSPRVTP
ncbi:energy-coupling factor transporter transmembrane protein EcfT [Arsenicicoccus piscis]|uniref:Cobalt ABC transporter permease n=1 Tax=Arsenicicoccus piscis TaxID=673954 RepID=A0ABQ6HQT5_9MICO|nr:energy-coupling factor transporter transmembrane component T [Arsenicicoccus piscis]MCH8628505.1 energy-coupling factor transporter transmembrane protein EcfT [Arsenicicoccus piscis]GMA19920.1 cobalt ABC transporter permease [Arsenicicoccus piscis]